MEVKQGNKIHFQARVHASIFKATLLTCFLYFEKRKIVLFILLLLFYYYKYYLNTSEHKIYFKSKSFRICIKFIATLFKQILYRNLWIIFHLKNCPLSILHWHFNKFLVIEVKIRFYDKGQLKFMHALWVIVYRLQLIHQAMTFFLSAYIKWYARNSFRIFK